MGPVPPHISLLGLLLKPHSAHFHWLPPLPPPVHMPPLPSVHMPPLPLPLPGVIQGSACIACMSIICAFIMAVMQPPSSPPASGRGFLQPMGPVPPHISFAALLVKLQMLHFHSEPLPPPPLPPMPFIICIICAMTMPSPPSSAPLASLSILQPSGPSPPQTWLQDLFLKPHWEQCHCGPPGPPAYGETAALELEKLCFTGP